MRQFLQLLLFIVFASSCEDYSQSGNLADVADRDTIPPVINLLGKQVDTAYLQITNTILTTDSAGNYTWQPGVSAGGYYDQGVAILDNVNGRIQCSRIEPEVTGGVNNQITGTYSICYNATDAAGNKAAAVTRTVYVVKNEAGFLNGNYDVACTCTATAAGAPNPVVTSSSYTAYVVTSTILNRVFELSALWIGREQTPAPGELRGNHFTVGFFNPEYASASIAGTLSESKNTFTVESTACLYSPAITYRCKNVYTIRLMIAREQVAAKSPPTD